MVGLLGRKLWGDIRAQRGQFAAIIATMMIGVVLFGASYDSYRNLQASYDQMFEELAFADRWFIGLDQGAAGALADVDGVSFVSARTVAEVPLRFNGEHVLLGRAVTMPSVEQPSVNQVHLLDGVYFDQSDVDGILLESHAADHFGVAAGGTVEILGQGGWLQLPVIGTVISPEYLWPARSRQDVLTSPDDFGVVFIPDHLLSRLAPVETRPEALVRYDATAARGDEVDVRVADAGRRLGAADTFNRAAQPSNAALNEDIQGFGEMSIMFPLLFVSATVMGTYILLSRLVQAQRPLIGTLLATGFRQHSIFWHYLGYGIVPGLIAAILGTASGVLLARWVTDLYADTIGLPFRVHDVHPPTVILGAALALAAGLIAAAPPALAAISISPAEAMRGAVPPGRGGTSVVERLIPPLSRLPIRWRLVIRNVGRQRRRSAYSAGGIVLALILVLVSWGMLDTTQILLNRQFEQIQRWDARVYLSEPTDAAELERLRAIEGVAVVEPVSTFGVVASRGDRSYATQLVAYEADTKMHGFPSTDGEWIQLPKNGILAGQSLEELLGTRTGERVTLQIPGSDTELDIVVADFVNEPLGTFLYISRDQLQSTFGEATSDSGISAAELIYSDGTDRAAIRERLMAAPSVVALTDARALVDTLSSFLGLFYAFVGVMLLFGGLMAGALIFTSMSASVAERAAELAGLRAAGISQGTLSRLVSVENLITAALGVAPGLLVGYIVSAYFMSSFSSDLFQFDLQMRWTTPVFSAIGVLLLALIAQIPALRELRRIDLGAVMRTRSL